MEEVLTKGNNCAIIVTLGITNGADATSGKAVHLKGGVGYSLFGNGHLCLAGIRFWINCCQKFACLCHGGTEPTKITAYGEQLQ